MKIKNEKDSWSGLLFVAVGIGFAWGAHNYSFGGAARPGPAYFPFGLGIVLALLGAVILFKALVIEVVGGGRIGGIAWKPLAIIIGSVALFGVLLPWLGLFIALPLLVFTAALAGDEFHWGEGAIQGVAGPESANNAGAQTSFIPMLTLGIPSNPVMGLMVGAMTIKGIQPGPQVMTSNPDLFWGLIASMWIGNAMLILLNLPLIGIWIKLLTLPYRFLFPATASSVAAKPREWPCATISGRTSEPMTAVSAMAEPETLPNSAADPQCVFGLDSSPLLCRALRDEPSGVVEGI